MDEAGIGGGNAVVITVCVGSSCHVRGSHEILKRYSDIIAEHRLKDQVSLRGSFCMERCAEGVNMDIDGEPVSAKTLKDAERIFHDKILSKLRPEPAAAES
jgi:NADH:ubiquinone oxidoreductase subunit E